MLTNKPGLADILDQELIGFLTAVTPEGQPQTSPVWFVRQDEDLVVYNQPTAPRLDSIAGNPRVAFNLRGDGRGSVVVTLEGRAAVEDLSPAREFPGYEEKYEREIERLGWTTESFSAEYSVGLRIVVDRVRAYGLDQDH
jgi:PPOX class probable F420-dependent enzyme